jgi:hypothetical protein
MAITLHNNELYKVADSASELHLRGKLVKLNSFSSAEARISWVNGDGSISPAEHPVSSSSLEEWQTIGCRYP